ncbi:hypothetical protein [Paraburkholderia sp. J7]|uniref:hypothetical protein n=1 Tax=Paraburkholderia sp. J7 TaxID=2805438 RepID=UPI002AB69070|nr:hypothetical protein [Paraburkholderia sp. J7]
MPTFTWSAFFEFIGKGFTAIVAAVGAWWAFEKWRKRDEHFPRMYFEVTANFLGLQDGQMIVEVVAALENKGVVPLTIKNLDFKLRGIHSHDRVEIGDESIRRQVNFPRLIAEGKFIPATWAYSFIYPGVRTEYNFVAAIPADISFIRVQADFEYLTSGRSHHAAKIYKLPSTDSQSGDTQSA